MCELPIVAGDLLDVLHALADAIHAPSWNPPEELHALISSLTATPPGIEIGQVERV